MLNLVISLLSYGLLLVLLLWCWYQWSHQELLRQAEKLPSLFPRLPFIGSIHVCVGRLDSITESLIWMWTTALDKGFRTYCFWAGPVPFLFTQDPDHVKKLLNSSTSLRKGEESEDSFKQFIYEGLLTAKVDHWKVSRRHVNPVFHPRNLQHMISVFNENSRELVVNLSEHVKSGSSTPFDVLHPLMDLGMKTVCQMMFGLDVEIDTKSQEFQGLKKFVEWLPIVFTLRIIKLWLRIDCIFNFLYRKEIKTMEEILRNFSQAPLKKAKEKYKLRKKSAEESDDLDSDSKPAGSDEEPLTVVDAYLRMQENLPNITDTSLQHEMATLYLTGTDTIGNGVASCLLALAQYQDIQDRLYTEIIAAVGPEGDVTSEDLKNFPYLEQVFKETLRFFTIVPFLSRRSTEEYQLGPCIVPPGTSVFICLAGLHMDPKIYPEPNKFDPERFSADKPMNVDGYTYIPFSGGPRNCIGKTYSFMLMKILMVHILRRYKVSTKMDIRRLKKNYAVTMVNCEGYNVILEERNRP